MKHQEPAPPYLVVDATEHTASTLQVLYNEMVQRKYHLTEHLTGRNGHTLIVFQQEWKTSIVPSKQEERTQLKVDVAAAKDFVDWWQRLTPTAQKQLLHGGVISLATITYWIHLNQRKWRQVTPDPRFIQTHACVTLTLPATQTVKRTKGRTQSRPTTQGNQAS